MHVTQILKFKRDFRCTAKQLGYQQNNFGLSHDTVYTTLNHVDTGIHQCAMVLNRMGVEFDESTGTDTYGGTYRCLKIRDMSNYKTS